MKDHWWRYLEESNDFYLVDSQEKRFGRISEMRRQIKLVQREIEQEDWEILGIAQKHWTPEEISQAKKDATKFSTVSGRTKAIRSEQ